MVDVAEVVVRATPEGVSDTTDELDEMSGKVEESTEEMEEQSESMSDLAASFKGAMGAAVAGMAVAVGGLLSQVPVLGESMAGLDAIFQALAFKIDGLLRPALGPLNNLLFRAATAINKTDGIAGKFLGTLALFGSLLVGAIAGLAGVKIASLGVVAGLKATVGILITAGKIIGGVIASIIGIKLALAIVIAAIAGFVVAYLTNWRGTRDKTHAIIDQIKQIVKRGFINFILAAIRFLKSFNKKAEKKFSELRNKVTTKLNNLIEDAKEFGRDLVSEFASGIRDKIGDAIAAASELASEVRDRLPGSPAAMGPLSDLDETGPGLIDTFTGGLDGSQLRIGLNGGGDDGNNAGAALARQEGRTVIEIEGRQVERATRDFRSDGTDLRGRYG